MAAPSKKASSAKRSAEGEVPTRGTKTAFHLIHGDDDYLVTEEARRVIAKALPKDANEFALETISGAAANQAEALESFRKLFEALQSQSFFAVEKAVWWRDTNLLGANPTATGAEVADMLSALGERLEAGLPPGVLLVITASEADGRRAIFKKLASLGKVTAFVKSPFEKKANEAQAIAFAHGLAQEIGVTLDHEAAVLLAEMTDGDSRTLRSELEKLAAYVGDTAKIGVSAVRAVGSHRPGGLVWDLADAVGERSLQKALAILDDLLFAGEKEAGLLYNLISRIRLFLLLRALADAKRLSLGGSYASFKGQLDRLPDWAKGAGEDKKANPLAGHPFMLWKTSGGAARYTQKELGSALRVLLAANEKLFSSGGESRAVLADALVAICAKG
ncbi:MAG: DNA polymerase III subunit delta [Verrucomicrobiae bacterium]|nr:DNA polymerase III subunit delta [Verrucomicrobiae bacterium]